MKTFYSEQNIKKQLVRFIPEREGEAKSGPTTINPLYSISKYTFSQTVTDPKKNAFAESLMRRYELTRHLNNGYTTVWRSLEGSNELKGEDYLAVIAFLTLIGNEKRDLRYLNTSLKMIDEKVEDSDLSQQIKGLINTIVQRII